MARKNKQQNNSRHAAAAAAQTQPQPVPPQQQQQPQPQPQPAMAGGTSTSTLSQRDRVRHLWSIFESWLSVPRTAMLSNIAAQLSSMDAKYTSTPAILRVPRDEFLTLRTSVRTGLEESFYTEAREEWARRLGEAGLGDEDWGEMSVEEFRRVERVLGGASEGEGEMEIEAAHTPVMERKSMDVSAPSPSSSFSSYAFVNPASLDYDDGDESAGPGFDSFSALETMHQKNNLEDMLTGTTPVQLSSSSSFHRSTTLYAEWGLDSSVSSTKSSTASSSLANSPLPTAPVSLPDLLARIPQPPQQQQHPLSQRAQTTSAWSSSSSLAHTQMQQTQTSASVSEENLTKSGSSKSARPGQKYIGAIVDSQEPVDEEADFERFKMEIRVQKIKEFHLEAADADIALYQDISRARALRKSSVPGAGASKREESLMVEEHEGRMLQLRRTKDEERKVVVDNERRKRREEIHRRMQDAASVSAAEETEREYGEKRGSVNMSIWEQGLASAKRRQVEGGGSGSAGSTPTLVNGNSSGNGNGKRQTVKQAGFDPFDPNANGRWSSPIPTPPSSSPESLDGHVQQGSTSQTQVQAANKSALASPAPSAASSATVQTPKSKLSTSLTGTARTRSKLSQSTIASSASAPVPAALTIPGVNANKDTEENLSTPRLTHARAAGIVKPSPGSSSDPASAQNKGESNNNSKEKEKTAKQPDVPTPAPAPVSISAKGKKKASAPSVPVELETKGASSSRTKLEQMPGSAPVSTTSAGGKANAAVQQEMWYPPPAMSVSTSSWGPQTQPQSTLDLAAFVAEQQAAQQQQQQQQEIWIPTGAKKVDGSGLGKEVKFAPAPASDLSGKKEKEKERKGKGKESVPAQTQQMPVDANPGGFWVPTSSNNNKATDTPGQISAPVPENPQQIWRPKPQAQPPKLEKAATLPAKMGQGAADEMNKRQRLVSDPGSPPAAVPPPAQAKPQSILKKPGSSTSTSSSVTNAPVVKAKKKTAVVRVEEVPDEEEDMLKRNRDQVLPPTSSAILEPKPVQPAVAFSQIFEYAEKENVDAASAQVNGVQAPPVSKQSSTSGKRPPLKASSSSSAKVTQQPPATVVNGPAPPPSSAVASNGAMDKQKHVRWTPNVISTSVGNKDDTIRASHSRRPTGGGGSGNGMGLGRLFEDYSAVYDQSGGAPAASGGGAWAASQSNNGASTTTAVAAEERGLEWYAKEALKQMKS